MTQMTYQKFTNDEAGIEVLAILVEDSIVETFSEPVDLWYMFAGEIGKDLWFAYAITDTLEGEPIDSLRASNIEELINMSKALGLSFKEIQAFGAAKAAMNHRESLHKMPPEIYKTIMESTDGMFQMSRKLETPSNLDWDNPFEFTISLN